MSDESQIDIPHSFVALYLRPGRIRPDAPREEIASRYEFCEDLATALQAHAVAGLPEFGVEQGEVLLRIRDGLQGGAAGVSAAEAEWVVRRLAELLHWPALAPAPVA